MDWRNNKLIGFGAGVVFVLSIIVIAIISRRFKPLPKVKIDTSLSIPAPPGVNN